MARRAPEALYADTTFARHDDLAYGWSDDTRAMAAIAAGCATAGLTVTQWHGDWHLSAFAPESPEIIVLGTRVG
jgi:hypothetical protein